MGKWSVSVPDEFAAQFSRVSTDEPQSGASSVTLRRPIVYQLFPHLHVEERLQPLQLLQEAP